MSAKQITDKKEERKSSKLEISKKLTKTIEITTISIIAFTAPAIAQTGDTPPQFQEITDFLTKIQELGIALGLLIAVLAYIYAGINWMTGEPDRQRKGRRIFVNATIGLILVLISSRIVEFTKGILTG